MPKYGILHDYDLMANNELSAKQQKCIICGTKSIVFQWSDYSGEAMCTICGCPYQLKWGSEEQEKENKYPYTNLKDEFIAVAKEYWELTNKFVHYGLTMSYKKGWYNFTEWLKNNHPEFIKE